MHPVSLSPATARRGLLQGLPLLALAAALLAPAPRASAQEADPGLAAPGSWQAHSAMTRVQAVTSGDGAMWTGTHGGLFRYDVDSGEIARYTTVEGLTNLDVRSLAFDDQHGFLWIGYADGVLDRLEAASGQIRAFFDIARAERYPQRGINRIRPFGDSLLIATDFGVVVFDIGRGEVRDTYDKFSGFDRGQPAHDIIAAPRPDGSAGFWVATRDGVAHASRLAANLRQPSAWTVDEQAPPNGLVLAYFLGRMYLGKQETPGEIIPDGDLWRTQPDGSWARQHVTGRSIYELIIGEGDLFFLSQFAVGAFRSDGSRTTASVQGVTSMGSGAVGPDGRLWMGSVVAGLARLPALPATSGPLTPEAFIVPAGPLTNDVLSIDVGEDGTLWVGYRPFFGVINGMGRFDGSWTNYASQDGFDVANAPIRAVKADRRGMGWGASEGDGVMRVSPDGEVVTFRADNSTLRGEPGFPNFIVTLGIDEDGAGNVWVTNREAPHVLHRWSEESGWTGIARPTQMPAVAGRVRSIYIDSFDQKWVALIRTTQNAGDGYMVVRTDPDDPTDTEAVAVTGTGSATTGTGLPHASVQAITQDLDGRIWIGTERGLATVFSPGSVMANPALAQPAWARTPDQASYFLRDLNIFAIAVDPAGRKWLASSSGAWLLNAEGNEVEAHFTPENSPLPSATVVDVAVDGKTGTVWFATDGGLMSFRGLSVEASPSAQRLRVRPNPYRPQQEPFVMIERLVQETRVRIMTVDGQVVAAFDARGGSATWDGRDQRTGQLVPSGVYLVAAAGKDGEGTAYGKIAVIR